jgi:hypothetical protein
MLTILKTHRFVKLAFSVALFGVLAGVVFGLQQQRKAHGVRSVASARVVSSTPAIKVLSVERSSLGNSSVLAVKLQNTTSKDIKAYSITNGRAWMTNSYFLTNDSFAAGTVIDQFIPLPSDSSSDFKIPLDGPQFTVAAAYFADGSSDGIPLYVSRIADKHEGMREQASRILPCLRGLAYKATTCEAEAENLPISMDGKSSDYESGLQDAKRELLIQLHEIKEKSEKLNFAEVVEKQEKVTHLFKELARPKQ